ncbi:soluble lytic murein transglycosylase precursor [bacterium BMS3Abin03]|nr:soluble lytic murein transglycosylase precursor [bacterium BMS3Abin03]HDZ58907.1 murein transglycosylase [Ignavibacteriales bacterium]
MNEIQLKITHPEQHFTTEHVNKLKPRYSPEQKRRLAEATKGFESLLTSMMLKSMTKTTGGMFGENSLGGDYFDTIFESELASYISHNKGMGISDLLYKKITGEDINSIPNIKKLNRLNRIKNPNIKTKDLLLPTINPTNSSLKRLQKYDHIIKEASNLFKIDKNLIKSVILTESAGNEKALSKASAKGLMQLMDATANQLGVNNVWNPKENIFGGTKYLADLLRQYNGDVKLALAGYNAGPGNVEKHNGIPPFTETKNYISRVLGYLKYFNG